MGRFLKSLQKSKDLDRDRHTWAEGWIARNKDCVEDTETEIEVRQVGGKPWQKYLERLLQRLRGTIVLELARG